MNIVKTMIFKNNGKRKKCSLGTLLPAQEKNNKYALRAPHHLDRILSEQMLQEMLKNGPNMKKRALRFTKLLRK